MKITRDFVVQNLADSGLMSADDASSLCESLSSLSGPADSDTVAQELSGTDKLTAYQAECVCRGETSGLLFGDYVVLEKIGQGGMGVVLKAQHTRMERIVAVKKLTAAALESEDLVKRFYREVKASARLLHPNVVTALDAREHEGVHYLIMEFIEGEDLSDVLKRQGPLPVDEAVDYVVQAAQGLEFAHKHGVYHRDIKPSNLMLTSANGGHPQANGGCEPTGSSTNPPADAGGSPAGVIKILDMGLARIVSEAKGNEASRDQLTSDDQVMGTCDYMAPEQAENTKGVDHRADIYSLGCTLYRLLTNQPPYTGANLMQLLLAHRESPIPSICDVRPDVPASVDAVFQKMVAKTREERYQSMTEVIEALQAALGRGSAPAAAPAPDPGLMDFLKQIHQEPSGVSRGGRGSGKTDAAQAAVTVQEKADPITDETVDLSATADTDPSTSTRQPSTPAAPAARPKKPAARRRKKQAPMLLLIGVGIGISLIGAAVVAAVLYVQTNHGTVVVKTDDKDVQVLVKRGGDVHVADAKNRWRIEVKSGKYSVELKGGDDKFRLDKHTVTVTRGDEVRVRVELKPRQVAAGRGPPSSSSTALTKHPDGAPVTGFSEVTDPEGNLEGDATRRFLDITKASVERKDGQYILTVVTAAPFPKELDEGLRMRFQWIIHFDQPEQLVQWPQGNFCRIGISCAGGRHPNWWVSLIPNKDFTGAMQKVVSRKQGLEVKSNTVSFAFAESELPEGPFAWWVGSDTAYSKDRLPNTGNPPTPRGMFVPSASAAATVGESPPTGVDAAAPSTASLDDLSPWQLPPDAPKPAIAPFDAVQAKEHQEAWAEYLKQPVERDFELPGGEKLTMRLIPPGDFLMGSGNGAPGASPQHPVRISRPFYLGKYEVTQAQWQVLMGNNPSKDVGLMNPAHVSWRATEPFLAKLNTAFAKQWMEFMLPTEAQWEYACRAGTATAYCFGDEVALLGEHAWFKDNSGGKTHPVGEKGANHWGLHDMHGNLWEWCADYHLPDYYGQSPLLDPVGPEYSKTRVLRGGGRISQSGTARSANRFDASPSDQGGYRYFGFRLACEIPYPPQKVGDPIDVLQHIDLDRDVRVGDWSMEDGVLVVPDQKDGGRLRLPLEVDRAYQLEMHVVNFAGGGRPLGIMLPLSEGSVSASFDSHGNEHATGLELVGGKSLFRDDENETRITSMQFQRGVPSTIVITVQSDRIQAVWDGKTAIDWQGDQSRLSLKYGWPNPGGRGLYLSMYNGGFRFTKITYTPEGKPAEAAMAASRPPAEPNASAEASQATAPSDAEETKPDEQAGAEEDSADTVRTWTDTSGKTVEAAFVEIQDGMVRLSLPDGKIASVALEKLSKQDQTYVAQQAERSVDP